MIEDQQVEEDVGRLNFTPRLIASKIDRDWRRINFATEVGNKDGALNPFGLGDFVGAASSTANQYSEFPADLTAKILGFDLSKKIAGETILIVGSGKSKLGMELVKSGAEAIDLDPNFGKGKNEIEVIPGSAAVLGRGENLPFNDKKFDEVFLAYLLCVVTHPVKVFEETWRVTKDGGLIRIYPVVSFVNLNTKPRLLEVRILRRGLDDFSMIIQKNSDRELERVKGWLFDPKKLCVKPDDTFINRRIAGYYYDREHDKPKVEWWLGDES